MVGFRVLRFILNLEIFFRYKVLGDINIIVWINFVFKYLCSKVSFWVSSCYLVEK